MCYRLEMSMVAILQQLPFMYWGFPITLRQITMVFTIIGSSVVWMVPISNWTKSRFLIDSGNFFTPSISEEVVGTEIITGNSFLHPIIGLRSFARTAKYIEYILPC